MFEKILIANRGEIACRIIRTAKSMGIRTIAVYSNADRHALHVQMADEAHLIGDSAAKASYLNIATIIEVARKTKAQAIHPGYGFLSENPEFAHACAEANIIFIGPSIAAIEAMASKQLAKQQLEKKNIPLTPGYHGKDQTDQQLRIEADKIGYPILLKAAAGGGGKGMRSVMQPEDFQAALAGARREAIASFADDTMIIEKLITHPRHIEVQIMADNFGQVIHLFERDCSIQRRHQKIIEEAPAANLSEKLRQGLTEAACEVARAIDYRGAGTVEFLVDKHEDFYFMEMNTRLQVEHPVTEMITGLDLVAWQIKIAANLPLPRKQEEIRRNGHAIECRIYAEDPTQDFIPSIGQIHFLQEPQGEGIRIDSGVQNFSTISQYYDPMIAKLISWGDSREIAVLRMQQALNHYYIGGVKTNLSFLKGIFRNTNFQKAKMNTHFFAEEELQAPTPSFVHATHLALAYDYDQLLAKETEPLYHDSFAWQMHLQGHWIVRYLFQNTCYEYKIVPINKTQFMLEENEQNKLLSFSKKHNSLSVDNGQDIIKAVIHEHGDHLEIYLDEGMINFQRYHWNMTGSSSGETQSELIAPMPSTVVAVLKNPGDSVKKGEQLIVLEAMKMEHTIYAPNDGIVDELYYEVGSQVEEGAELLKLS